MWKVDTTTCNLVACLVLGLGGGDLKVIFSLTILAKFSVGESVVGAFKIPAGCDAALIIFGGVTSTSESSAKLLVANDCSDQPDVSLEPRLISSASESLAAWSPNCTRLRLLLPTESEGKGTDICRPKN